MRYLTLSELIYINGTVLKNAKILNGTQEIRDQALLEAAAARPAASVFGADAYETLGEKAAALFHSIARNHPFTDGNKRTATVAVLFMCLVNDQCVAWQPEDALEMIVSVADGRRDFTEMAAWLPLRPCGSNEDLSAPDAQHDIPIIAGIIEEQRWLLNELEKR